MSEVSLIEAVERAGEADLESLDERIQQLEADRGSVDARIASLQSLRKVIEIRLYGPPQKKPRKPREQSNGKADAEPDDPEHGPIAVRVLTLLNRIGPLDPMGICRRLSVAETSLNMSLAKPRARDMFRTLSDGRIAPADWKDVGEG